MKRALDIIFPPLCVACGEKTDLKYLCNHCWEESMLLDPETRCRHCFAECTGYRHCKTCLKKPVLPFERAAVFDRNSPLRTLLHGDKVRAAAGFAYYQWEKLEWEEPDLIVPIPPNRKAVAHAFSELFQKPCPNLFHRFGLSATNDQWKFKSHLIDENTCLLLLDEGSSWQELRMVARELISSFPKKVYCLSLYA